MPAVTFPPPRTIVDQTYGYAGPNRPHPLVQIMTAGRRCCKRPPTESGFGTGSSSAPGAQLADLLTIEMVQHPQQLGSAVKKGMTVRHPDIPDWFVLARTNGGDLSGRPAAASLMNWLGRVLLP